MNLSGAFIPFLKKGVGENHQGNIELNDGEVSGANLIQPRREDGTIRQDKRVMTLDRHLTAQFSYSEKVPGRPNPVKQRKRSPFGISFAPTKEACRLIVIKENRDGNAVDFRSPDCAIFNPIGQPISVMPAAAKYNSSFLLVPYDEYRRVSERI